MGREKTELQDLLSSPCLSLSLATILVFPFMILVCICLYPYPSCHNPDNCFFSSVLLPEHPWHRVQFRLMLVRLLEHDHVSFPTHCLSGSRLSLCADYFSITVTEICKGRKVYFVPCFQRAQLCCLDPMSLGRASHSRHAHGSSSLHIMADSQQYIRHEELAHF